MRSIPLCSFRRAFLVIPIIASAALTVLAAAQPRYSVIDLGASAGSSPTAVSDAGHISGVYFAPGGQRRGFVSDRGVFSDIGTLGGIAQALDVNDSGVVVGYSVDGQNRQRAVRVVEGLMTDLGVLSGGIHANANAINDSGWIVGMSQKRFGNETYQRAALWRNGTIMDLGTFGGEYSEAVAANNAGQVVGWAWYPLPTRRQHAFIWSDATGMIDLGTLGGYTSIASDINDHGAVVGFSNVAPASGGGHAFLWTPEDGMVDLGAPPGNSESFAAAINNAGLIVGDTFDEVECVSIPLLWENGELILINGLIDPASGWTVVSASDINDRGEITGVARRGQEPYTSVLLVPRIVGHAEIEKSDAAVPVEPR